MKKRTTRVISLILCVITIVFCFASCNSRQPYDYDLEAYITIPENLSGISVTEAEIQQEMLNKKEQVLKNNLTYTANSNYKAEVGDLLEVSFNCYYTEGTKTVIPQISDSNCTLILGEGKYPEAFENALLGKEISDAPIIVTVKLPEEFTALDLDGKEVKYEITINKISRSNAADIVFDDAFVKAVLGYESVSEYDAYLYARVKEEIIFNKLLEKSSVIVYPENEIRAYTNSFVKYYTDQANSLQISLEEYINKKFFISITDFRLEEDAYAKKMVKKEMLVYRIARMNNIEASEEEYNTRALAYAKQYGLETVAELEGKFGTANIKQTILMDLVLEYLSSQIVVTP